MHPDEGIDLCGRCAVELIGVERDHYRTALERIIHQFRHGPYGERGPRILVAIATDALRQIDGDRDAGFTASGRGRGVPSSSSG